MYTPKDKRTAVPPTQAEIDARQAQIDKDKAEYDPVGKFMDGRDEVLLYVHAEWYVDEDTTDDNTD